MGSSPFIARFVLFFLLQCTVSQQDEELHRTPPHIVEKKVPVTVVGAL